MRGNRHGQQKQKQAIDQVLRDMAGAMTAGLALVGSAHRPLSRDGGQGSR